MKKKIMAGAVLLLAASIFIGGCGIKSVSTDTGAGYTVTDATVVPIAAIQRGQPGTFVYLVKPDDTVTIRVVELGASDGDKVAITKGLQVGDNVVVDGVDRLRDGAKIRRPGATPRTAGGPPVATAVPEGKAQEQQGQGQHDQGQQGQRQRQQANGGGGAAAAQPTPPRQ